MIYIMYSLAHFHGWTLEGDALIVLLTVSLQFLAKEDQGFAVLFGILVVTCIDGVHLFVCVHVLCESFHYFSFSKLGK